MISILAATSNDALLLSEIGSLSLVESHGHSAPEADIKHYVQTNMSEEAFLQELSNPDHLYHIIFSDGQPAGYSKMMLNTPHENVPEQNVTKLGRIYVLKEFYGRNIGIELFKHIVALSKAHQQAGLWLNVWVENHRAIKFYQKQGFEIVGKYDFEVSPTHFNPNHVMYLKYEINNE